MGISNFHVKALEQGSDAWLEWRRNGIGASDAPIIMGENPWKTVSFLLREKTGEGTNFKNHAMMEGTKLEPEARKKYEAKIRVKVKPACLQSNRYDWQRASVDGLHLNKKIVVEIKCGVKTFEEALSRARVPEHYYGQLQHILAVTDFPGIDFWCYRPGCNGVHLRIHKNESYIKRLLRAEAEFWEELRQFLS